MERGPPPLLKEKEVLKNEALLRDATDNLISIVKNLKISALDEWILLREERHSLHREREQLEDEKRKLNRERELLRIKEEEINRLKVESEKVLKRTAIASKNKIKLNIGGSVFVTSENTLLSVNGNLFEGTF
jgi:hypothetical protein